jgi:hypothetical protein
MAGIQPWTAEMDSRLGGNDKTAASGDTSEPLFRGEWRSSLDHPHHSANFLEREYVPYFEDFCKPRGAVTAALVGVFAASLGLRLLLELHAARQGAVDDEVRSGRETRGGAGEKDDAAADLLRFRHPPGRVQ